MLIAKNLFPLRNCIDRHFLGVYLDCFFPQTLFYELCMIPFVLIRISSPALFKKPVSHEAFNWSLVVAWLVTRTSRWNSLTSRRRNTNSFSSETDKSFCPEHPHSNSRSHCLYDDVNLLQQRLRLSDWKPSPIWWSYMKFTGYFGRTCWWICRVVYVCPANTNPTIAIIYQSIH